MFALARATRAHRGVVSSLAVLRASLASLAPCFAAEAEAPPAFESFRLTPVGEYTKGIEGPAVDSKGNLYVVNFQRPGTVGIIRAAEKTTREHLVLPTGSIGNGIRVDAADQMFIADYRAHRIYSVKAGRARVHFASSDFKQPNDLALRSDGVLLASDPDFRRKTGRIWMILGPNTGRVLNSDRVMGVTNGLDFNPDETSVYVSESDTRQIWAYKIRDDALVDGRLVISFASGELDGLRTDVDGLIYVARPGAGRVSVVHPRGELVREIPTLGKDPTNLTFGGGDGRTVYVTQADGRFVESFKAVRPGREICRYKWKSCE